MKRFLRPMMISLLSFCLAMGLQSVSQFGLAQSGGASLVQVGRTQYQAGQYAEAAQSLGQAIATYHNAQQPLAEARTLALQSLAFDKLGRWSEANAAIAHSLTLIADIRATTPPASVSQSILNLTEAQILSSQGKLLRSQGNAKAALDAWETAEDLYEQENDLTGLLGSRINQVKALETLGFYRRAEKQLDDITDQLQSLPDSPLKAHGLLSLGNLLRLEGELLASEETLKQGIALASDHPQMRSQLLLGLANTERLLASQAQAVWEREQAARWIQQALAHYQSAEQLASDPTERAQIQLNRLALLTKQGGNSNSSSSDVQKLAHSLFQNLSQLPASRRSIYAKVNFIQQIMDTVPADAEPPSTQLLGLPAHHLEALLRRSIEQAQVLGDRRSQSYALGALGHWFEIQTRTVHGNTTQGDITQGDITQGETTQGNTVQRQQLEAQQLTRQALEQAQRANAPEISYQWQWQLGRITQANRPETNRETLGYYQAAYDTLNELRSELVALAPDIQFSFREQVEPVYRELVELLLHDARQENLEQARDVIENLQLAELDNFFRDACAQTQAIRIDDLDPHAAIVYPILLPDHLELILKLPGENNLRHFSQPHLTAEQVENTVRQFRLNSVRRSISFEQFSETSTQLYDWLIRPLEQDLEATLKREESQIKTLSFVLDGGLRGLPMAALYDGDNFLVERYAIAVTPGLQLLSPKPLGRQNLQVLLGGTDDSPSFKSEGFTKLTNVPFELREIHALLENSEILEQENFQKQTINQKLEAESYNIVHLATHGQFSSDPEQTFVLDWDGRINIREIDRLLRPSDPSQSQSIELLVLSACETAKGDSRAALGLAGVAIRAGARSTLATLWQVDDASTAEFMVKFYQKLSQTQQSKAEVLRDVQLSFLRDYPEEDFERPYHWAPFLLIGNWL